MESIIEASEMPLNADGSIYHLHLQPEQLAHNIILVGDPGRVPTVSKYFDRIDYKVQNRELLTHTGRLNGKPVTALSTGMGTDNIDIVINELDALVNVDLKERRRKKEHTALNLMPNTKSTLSAPPVTDWGWTGFSTITAFPNPCTKKR